MYIEVDPSTLRAALRIYFLVTCSLIALVGDQCCLLRSKVLLARNRPVSLTHTTGWLRGPPLLYSIYRLRRLPGGFILGFLMFLLTLTALLADLAVSGFVRGVQVPALCDFGEGLVFPAVEADVSLFSQEPGPMSKAFSWAFSSQIISLDHGGVRGIYHKTYNGTKVRARPEDVRAFWQCDYNGPPRLYASTYNTSIENITYIRNDLVQAGLFFTPNSAISVSSWEDRLSHHFGLSSSWSKDPEPATSSVTPEIRLFFSEEDDLEHDQTHIAVVKCTMRNADGPTNMVARIINMAKIFGAHVPFVSAQFWDEVTQTHPGVDPLLTTELWLNAMVMTAGTAGSITSSPNAASPGGEKYGCLHDQADVPWPVIALVLFTIALFVSFSLYGLVLFVWLYRFKRRSDTDAATLKKLLKHTPNDLVGWMRQATYETPVSLRATKERELVQWSIGAVPGRLGTRLGVIYHCQGTSVEMSDAATTALTPNAEAYVAADNRSPTLFSKSPVSEQKLRFDG